MVAFFCDFMHEIPREQKNNPIPDGDDRHRQKVIATANRCENIYKRTGERSVNFDERGGTVKTVTDFFYKKNRNERN